MSPLLLINKGVSTQQVSAGAEELTGTSREIASSAQDLLSVSEDEKMNRYLSSYTKLK